MTMFILTLRLVCLFLFTPTSVVYNSRGEA